jgi:hypothetical protein
MVTETYPRARRSVAHRRWVLDRPPHKIDAMGSSGVRWGCRRDR